MEQAAIRQEEKLSLLEEMLTCGASIYRWTYAARGHLMQTNCPDLVLDVIFESIGCKAYMLEYGKAHTAPLVLGGPLGLIWCAAFERQEGALDKMHVLGPVFNSEISMKGLQESMQAYDIPLDFRPRLWKLLCELPVVSTPLFFQYALMLHYCATGEKLERSDIQFQSGETDGGQKSLRPKDRHRTYSAEQTLLWMVREGNLDYQSALDRVGELSSGVRISTGKPMEQEIISCAVFTSLCVRAAIEGGLSPENAYTLGDSYIQSMTQCRTVAELTSLNHAMYADFVHRVHKNRINAEQSKQVRDCCEYIELHLEEPITLQQLSRLVGYKDYYLSRKFKNETGFSINDYIKFARIDKAKLLLSTTSMPVRDIARQLQFCSASYFAQVFQTVAGVTPQQWRDRQG